MGSGSPGFFNFVLFYFLRYKFRNSLKLCPCGLGTLKTTAGFSLKAVIEFVDEIKGRRRVSSKARRSQRGAPLTAKGFGSGLQNFTGRKEKELILFLG